MSYVARFILLGCRKKLTINIEGEKLNNIEKSEILRKKETILDPK